MKAACNLQRPKGGGQRLNMYGKHVITYLHVCIELPDSEDCINIWETSAPRTSAGRPLLLVETPAFCGLAQSAVTASYASCASP